MSNYVIVGGELMHYGVKGMKWGVRRFENKNGTLTPAGKRRYSDDVYEKKAAYKQAKKDYNKSFNKAYNKSVAAYSPIKKHRKANDERWDDAFKKAESANKAKTDYKKAKKDYDNSPEGKAAAAERRKKAIKVGAAVAGTALAVYGAKKFHDYIRSENGKLAQEAGRKAMEEASNWTSTKGFYDLADFNRKAGRYDRAFELEEKAAKYVVDYGLSAQKDIEKMKFARAAANVYLNRRR